MKAAQKTAEAAALKASPEQEAHLYPEIEETATHYCYVTVEDTTSKAYSDQTGRFPVPSISSNTQVFILYHYDSNQIFLEPMKGKAKKACYKPTPKSTNESKQQASTSTYSSSTTNAPRWSANSSHHKELKSN
jgi:hypothetical protein